MKYKTRIEEKSMMSKCPYHSKSKQ